MLLGSEGFDSLARVEVQYTNLGTSTWGQADRTIHYSYDANGSLEKKIIAVTGAADPENNYIEKYEYDYNLANRLETVTHYSYEDIDIDTNDDHIKEVTTYTYNDDGIRVAADYERSVDYYPLEGTFELYDQRSTTYLVDSYNHTGYAQTLEESTDITYKEGSPVSISHLTTYLIGDDVIAQTKDGTTQYLLYDGHGSTRQLADYDSGTDTVTIADTFSYDAYGVMLGGNPTPDAPVATSLLYAGEQFDLDAQQYYLRARYYDPLNGRFNRMDPFSGSLQDPQSLHKYLYAHGNPINNIDPSGKLTAGSIAATMPTIGNLVNLHALAAAAAVTLGIVIVDKLYDSIRKRGVLLHVRDKTLIRLAKRCNGGALLAGPLARMYFTPVMMVPILDPQGIINNAVFQGGIAARIKKGVWDVRTQVGINALIANCPSAAAAIASDPSLVFCNG